MTDVRLTNGQVATELDRLLSAGIIRRWSKVAERVSPKRLWNVTTADGDRFQWGVGTVYAFALGVRLATNGKVER